MTGIHVTQSFDTRSQFQSRMRPRKRTPLPELDHLQLQHHLEQCERFRQPEWRLLACVLRDKIKMTDPVSDPPARDLAIGGSRVTYSVNRGPARTGLLAHRARSASGISVIPVASLLGATLIGMVAGQRAPLLLEGGSVLTVRLLEVSSPA